ncbi:Ribosomal RNA-processing protein 1 homolog [Taphrina deformans PYCC 5710]|uniref:Ribosomal RNA-processing protein 1 homolog n=1 Tax=Taphrina deformans (strain PYCC 5710 / ATCC 11124 / CBS 356.35 / IMI 108563 / JCM 9778 / NBRC 8474) TaxID=1097556 RepID=R4X9U2_TAPDE|nr:Ribosomal RNA-processing protein 1 homolog [Taphrina deformans PYCC 5710]|eukprot:CCG82247.1 Ribosomal RNA-processing protein 1 homolog [Taphrina deformans PYCC 5710]
MSSPFLKQLVASDRKIRDAALASLTKFLSANRQFEELELLKLWKGLFYCFWHSDRTLVQQNLANDLSNLVLTVRDNNLMPFLNAFWITICREWNSIDILRLDKFYTLLRRFIGTAFQKLRKLSWKESFVNEYISLLEALPLSVDNVKVPNGIRYHLADIYIEELSKAVPEQERKKVPIDIFLRPFETIITKSPTKAVRLRVMKSVFEDKTLTEYGYEMAADASDDGELPDADSDGESEEVDEDDEEAEFAGFD